MDDQRMPPGRGIAAAKVGNRIGDMQLFRNMLKVMAKWCCTHLVGHGKAQPCTRFMVPYYGRAGRGCACVRKNTEPMIVIQVPGKDFETGWAHKTLDGGLSCQYEHQFVITKDGLRHSLTSQGERRNLLEIKGWHLSQLFLKEKRVKKLFSVQQSSF